MQVRALIGKRQQDAGLKSRVNSNLSKSYYNAVDLPFKN